ncbi:MAG: EamA family transporter [Clostridia bacterium]
MWLLFAVGSAFFAGITAILAKIGIRNTDSNVATAIRTIIVLAFSWLMVWVVGSFPSIETITPKTLLFLTLSGLATGGSWLCYFKALQLGDVNKVTPIDKSSTVLTMLLAFLLLGEPLSVAKGIGMVLILVGTYLMITKKEGVQPNVGHSHWFLFAALSAVFASLTAILGKLGIAGVESNLGTAIRTIVVLVMAWTLVFATKKQGEIKQIDRRSWLFICLSGITTGLSWLCYYRALQDGQASLVVPIDKLSILVTIALSYFLLKEKISKKALLGLVIIVAGTLTLLF